MGADGGHSTVRRLLGIGFTGETREEQRMFLADVRAEGVDRDHWHTWPGDEPGRAGAALAMCPLAGTDTFQLTKGLRSGADAADDPDVLLVVRPDGYVGLALDAGDAAEVTAARVESYLAGLIGTTATAAVAGTADAA